MKHSIPHDQTLIAFICLDESIRNPSAFRKVSQNGQRLVRILVRPSEAWTDCRKKHVTSGDRHISPPRRVEEVARVTTEELPEILAAHNQQPIEFIGPCTDAIFLVISTDSILRTKHTPVYPARFSVA